MKTMKYKLNKVLYVLTVEDFQNIANEELGRNLTDQEIDEALKSVEEKINWSGAISDSISEKIDN